MFLLVKVVSAVPPPPHGNPSWLKCSVAAEGLKTSVSSQLYFKVKRILIKAKAVISVSAFK